MDATTLELDAVKFAQLAVQRDQSGRYQEAVFYYKVRRGRAGSLGAPVSPSPRRGPHDALELPEGSPSPLRPREAGEGCSAAPRPGTALPAERDALGQRGRPRPPPAGVRRGPAARPGEGEAVPAETRAEGRACASKVCQSPEEPRPSGRVAKRLFPASCF